LGGTYGFRLSQLLFGIKDLSLQIADTYRIIVYQTKTAYACTRQIKSDGRA
jgi:hypothetical protein